MHAFVLVRSQKLLYWREGAENTEIATSCRALSRGEDKAVLRNSGPQRRSTVQQAGLLTFVNFQQEQLSILQWKKRGNKPCCAQNAHAFSSSLP